MKTVFIVDDNKLNLFTAQRVLSNDFNVYTLSSASAMFELMEKVMPDLILLDIKMPKMNGFEAMKLLKENEKYMSIPVIFLTSQHDDITEVHGFEMGAVDFIHKPFSTSILFNRIKAHLDIDEIIRERTLMLQQRTERLHRLKNSMVSVLAEMLESRDKTTGGHIERTSAYLRILMTAMIERGIYAEEITNWDFDLVVLSARLHDVGKVAISDLILNKPGSLTVDEFENMKDHAAEGERIISKIINQAGDEDFLINAKLFAGYHHERWDGEGYPHGIKGEKIPLQGRIMALADVYDSLVSDRPYKSAFTHEKAVEIIKDGKGSHFDPKIVDVFLDIHSQFSEISSRSR